MPVPDSIPLLSIKILRPKFPPAVSLFPSKKASTREREREMAEGQSKIEEMRRWIVDHKLRAVGCLWLSGIGGSIAYNWSRPNMKPSVKIIHARLHAQALTLAALAGAAVVEYYDNQSNSGQKVDKYMKQYLATQKD